jgi:DNA polymerase-1
MEKARRQAHRKEYAETMSGRRRLFPDINSGNPRFSASSERAAVNHPVQGFEADIIKTAMIKAADILKKKGWWGKRARLLLSIHDELLLEVEDDMIKDIAPLLKNSMENVWPDFPVHLAVHASCGKTWGAMKPLA